MQKGFATLMAVLIVGAIGAAVAVSFLSRGIDASKNAISIEAAAEARLLADQCAEIALQEIRNNTAYLGSGESSSESGTCSYVVTQDGGTRRNITSTGKAGDATKKVLVELEGIDPKIIIISWHEIS
jgi:hypothetical protein